MKKLIKILPVSLLFVTLVSSCSLISSGRKNDSEGENDPKNEYLLIDNVNYKVHEDYAEVAYFENVEKIVIKSSIEVDGVFYPVTTINNYEVLKYKDYDSYSCIPYLSNVKEVTIPDSIKSIKSFGLAFLDSVEKLVIPNTVERMETGVLFETTNLLEIYLPSFGTDHGLIADLKSFIKEKGYSPDQIENYIHSSDSSDYISYDSYNFLDEVLCFSRLFKCPTGYFYHKEFYGDNTEFKNNLNIYLTGGNYIFPFSFKKINNYTLHLCPSIDTIFERAFSSMGDTVDFASFDQYLNMKYADLDSYLPSFANITINGSTEVKNLIIPENYPYIFKDQFDFLTGIESISIPLGLESYSFLEKIYLANAKTSYYEGAFYYGNDEHPYIYLAYASDFAEECKIHEECCYVKSGAFANANNLRKVTLNKNAKEIKPRTFENLSKLNEVIFPEGCQIETIGYDAFANTGLTHIHFPNTIKNIGSSAFYRCRALKEVSYEDGISDLIIEDRAFWDCISYRNVMIPEGTIKIDYLAFSANTAYGNYLFYIPSTLKDDNIEHSIIDIPYSEEENKISFVLTCSKKEYRYFFSLISEDLRDDYIGNIYENRILVDNRVYKNVAGGLCFDGFFNNSNEINLREIPDTIGSKKVVEVNLLMDNYASLSRLYLNNNCERLVLNDNTPSVILVQKGLKSITSNTDKRFFIYFMGNEEEFDIDITNLNVTVYFYSETKPVDGLHYFYIDEDGEIVRWIF